MLEITAFLIMVTANVLIKFVKSTIDLNASELQYIADHLTKSECAVLGAALHSSSEQLAVGHIEAELPCLDMLLEWNWQEGVGQTHELLSRRLRQIKRPDMASWLDKVVFHELGKDLERSLDHPFDDVANITKTYDEHSTYTDMDGVRVSDDHWFTFDIICFVLIAILSALTCVVLWNGFVKQWFRQRNEVQPKFLRSQMNLNGHHRTVYLLSDDSDSSIEIFAQTNGAK